MSRLFIKRLSNSALQTYRKADCRHVHCMKRLPFKRQFTQIKPLPRSSRRWNPCCNKRTAALTVFTRRNSVGSKIWKEQRSLHQVRRLPPLEASTAVPLTEDDEQKFRKYSSHLFRSKSDKDHFERELHTINVAVVVNLAIFVAKLAACYSTKSSSLFAEAIHSLADVGNQVLLRTGVLQALKGPTKMYNYGHSREKFVWSLISAVGVFFLGAGVSLFNGIQGIISPRQLEESIWVFYVLGASFIMEGYSFLVALRTIKKHATLRNMKLLDYILLGKDPTPIAVMLEDSGAVLGILVASACMTASHLTKNPLWDSIGSVVIGVLMGVVATFLIRMNRSYLIGRSISTKEINLILKQLEGDPVVKRVYDCKSEEIAPGKYRFKAEIDFSGPEVVRRHLALLEKNCVYDRLRHASWSKDDRALHMALTDYGTELVSQVGFEVDKLEEKIRKVVPGVLHVDLEVDRGRIERGLRCSINGQADRIADPIPEKTDEDISTL